jgi:hypothetical protein
MQPGWLGERQIGFRFANLLCSALVLALLLACQQDEPAPAPPQPESPLAAPLVSPTAGETSPASPLPPPVAITQILRAGQLPPASHDLLFISEGFLRHWDHQTGQINTLIGPAAVGLLADQHQISLLKGPGPPTGTVLEYAVNGQGQMVVVTFQRGDANRLPSSNVFLYDHRTQQRFPLPADHGEITLPGFSPDGNWIAWVLLRNDAYAQRPPGLAAAFPQTTPQQGLPVGQVYVAPSVSLRESRRVGSCGLFKQGWLQQCTGLFWSADSGHLLWQDVDTIWSISPTGAAPPMQYKLPVGSGEPQAPSPSGRYLLTRVPGVTEGSSLAVVDLQMGRTMAVAGTFEYTSPGARVLWLADDRLLVIHHADLLAVPSVREQAESNVTVEVWQMSMPPNDLLQLVQRVSLPARAGTYAAGQQQLDKQHVVFALLNPDAEAQQMSGLFLFDLITGALQRRRSLPPMGKWDDSATARDFPDGFFWSPDGSDLLIQDTAQQTVFLAPAVDGPMLEIGHLLGQSACCFTWVAPLPERGQTGQIIIPDVYTGAYHYQLTFATELWRLENDDREAEDYSPELAHRAIDGCRMYLRDGPRGLQLFDQKTLGGNIWSLSVNGDRYPTQLTYSLPQEDAGISFIIRLEMPLEASDEVRQACQLAAEAVINTFQLIPPPLPPNGTATVICRPDEAGCYHCHDHFLGIQFVYPMTWGTLATEFSRAGLDGNYYNYQFGQSKGRAGGRGKIISPRGRGRMWTDFSGYQPDRLFETCQTYSAAYCEEFKPGVLVMLQRPDSASICQPATMGAPGFLAFVAVNLPDHDQITGLIFPMPLYPAEILAELDRLLSRANPSTDCQDPARRARYDERVAELFAELATPSTEATDAWYQPIFQWAEAVVIDP